MASRPCRSVKVLRHVPRIHLLFRCQGFRQLGAGRRIVALGGRVQLHTIAGGEQDDFQLREALSEPMQRLANPLRPERETLADGDGCMVMAAPQKLHVHEIPFSSSAVLAQVAGW